VFNHGHEITDRVLGERRNRFALARIVNMRFPGIRVIVTSGHPQPSAGDLTEGTRFLPKPYLLSALIGMVRGMLSGTAKPVTVPLDAALVAQVSPVLPTG
jgi:hypothetical protein